MKKIFISVAILATLSISAPVMADDDEQFCFWKFVKGRIVRVCW